MNTYEYALVKMEPVFTNADTVEEILNQKGEEGYRYIGIQKLWTEDSDGQSIQRNFIVLERKSEEDL
jgi:hypothetical protein